VGDTEHTIGGKAPPETTHPQSKWEDKVWPMSNGEKREGERGGGGETGRRGEGQRVARRVDMTSVRHEVGN